MYDQFKQLLLYSGLFGDTIITHFTASTLAVSTRDCCKYSLQFGMVHSFRSRGLLGDRGDYDYAADGRDENENDECQAGRVQGR